MIRCLASSAMAGLMFASAFANAAEPVVAAEAEPTTRVFVAERISVEPIPDHCAVEAKRTGELSCISLDSLFRATYRVVQPVIGGVADEEVQFTVADHYGFPRFARFRHALLFIGTDAQHGNWLHKYQAIPVQRTASGEWVTCGDQKYEAQSGTLLAAAEPMTFPEPWVRLRDLPEFERELMRDAARDAPGTYRVSRGKLYCLRGVRIADAYGIVRDGVMQARGVSLPSWPTGG